tara:strand:+ start:1628 stop:1783 length:156 start_codon:yes stop_codon:yes gene_type:complete
MQAEPLTRASLAAAYFGGALMMSAIAHDLGTPPVAVGLIGCLLTIGAMVRQ